MGKFFAHLQKRLLTSVFPSDSRAIKFCLGICLFTFILSFLSFRYLLEQTLFPFVGLGWAYVIDQGFVVVFAIVVTVIVLSRQVKKSRVRSFLKRHGLQIAILFVVAFLAHALTLHYYFWSDEVIWLLKPITQNTPRFFFHGDIFKGYFVLSYALLYLLFGVHHYWIYALASILYFCITVPIIYIFMYLLSQKRTIAFIGAGFVAVSPGFLDMFTWHSTAHAPVLGSVLVSMIFFVLFLKNRKLMYYILSLIFFFVATKIGFIRIAPFFLIPFILTFIPSPLWSRKQAYIQKLLILSPFIVITFSFLVLNFFYPELTVIIRDFMTNRSSEAVTTATTYRGLEMPQTMLPKLFYFTSHVFIPSGLFGEFLKFSQLDSSKHAESLALLLGSRIVAALVIIIMIWFFSRRNISLWLLGFAALFILVNLLHIAIGYEGLEFHPTQGYTPQQLDIRYANENIGYGPGSRYVFVSTVGAGLLGATLASLLLFSRRKKLRVVGVVLVGLWLCGSAYYTVRAQVKSAKNLQAYSFLPKAIFAHVPRNGEPKLIYSANPDRNGIDTKIAGWKWFHGFYKESEFRYTKVIGDVIAFLQEDEQNANRLFAFYSNPQTLSFTDVTDEVLWAIHSPRIDTVLLREASSSSSLKKANADVIFQRAVLELPDINRRLIMGHTLRFRTKVSPVQILSYPLVYLDPEKEIIPPSLWGLQMQKSLQKKDYEQHAFHYLGSASAAKRVDQLLDEERKSIEQLLLSRSRLKDGVMIVVNDALMPNNDANSLMDSLVTSFPVPQDHERYLQFVSLPASITISLSQPTTIGRILLNTPHKYSQSKPTELQIEVIQEDGEGEASGAYQNVGKTIDDSVSAQSLNIGYLTSVVLDDPVRVSALRITITKTASGQPPVFDEVDIDGSLSVRYSPEIVNAFIENAASYIPLSASVDALSEFTRPYALTLYYACAEQRDWLKQESAIQQQVPDIWKSSSIPIDASGEQDVEIPLDCNGSVLRKIVFIGPPYPSEIGVSQVRLQQDTIQKKL